jgi:ATP-binding cassette subfamily B protein
MKSFITGVCVASDEHGHAVVIGKHNELIVNNPLYARLAQLQFGENGI